MTDTVEPIPWHSGRLLLGYAVMDETHAAFAALVNRLALARDAEFAVLFSHLLEHTVDHFAGEEAMMAESGFPALAEHRDEHRRVLGEMRTLQLRANVGRLALVRSYVCNGLPGWFALHAATMDSALAAHLRGREPKAG